MADSKSKKKVQVKKKVTNDDGQEVEEEEETKAPAKDEEPKYKTYDDLSMTLFDIFGAYGCSLKSQLPEHPELHFHLWYDFKPYNSKDPVLLALMHKDLERNKTI